MDFSVTHGSFVVVAYGLTAICLLGLGVYVLHRDWALAKKVKALSEKSDP
jgi:heme exporter protein CcmD